MKKFIIGVLTMGIISMLMGCNGNLAGTDGTKVTKETVTIDYAEYPENFMIQLAAGQKYALKNGDTTTEFCAKTNEKIKSRQIMTFGNHEVDLSNTVYYRNTEPVLIHYNGKDYVWICEKSESGGLIGASFYYFIDDNSRGSDSGSINLRIGSEVLDPDDFVMEKCVDCFGLALTEAHYRINEKGKPEEIPSDDAYYYIESPDTEDKLRLEDDIHTWVYADAGAQTPTVEDLPAGTMFHRLRVPKDEEYSYVEGILDDGRVFRVVEEYWFSEPTSVQVMMDKDGKQFSYSFVD